MDPDRAQTGRQRLVIGGTQSAVAAGAQILGGIETKTADGAHAAGAPSAALGPDRLGRVFDHRHTIARGDLPDGIHVHAAAE